MENGSKILTRNKSNILDNFKNINNLNSTSSYFHHKKLKLRNEILTSQLKLNDNINSGDFSLDLKQFSNNAKNTNFSQNIEIKSNLDLKSIKPNHLIKINDIINLSDKKIISRNKNFSFLNQISSKDTTKFSSKKYKKLKIFINRINNFHSNIFLKNQKKLNSPIVDLNTKVKNIPNSIEQDISRIKNIKEFSINNINFNNNFNDQRIVMPSLLSSSSPNPTVFIKEEKNQINNNNIYNDSKKSIQNNVINNDYKIYNNSIQIENKNKVDININNNKINIIEGNNDKKELKLFEKRIKSDENLYNDKKNNKIGQKNKLLFEIKRRSNNNTFDNSLKKNISQEYINNKSKYKYSSNQFLCKLDRKINNFLENNSVLVLSNNKPGSIQLYNEEKKLENNENKIESKKEDINDNRAKIARLSRLKKSSLKSIKSKNRVIINDIKDKKEEEIKNYNKNGRIENKRYQTDFLKENKESKSNELDILNRGKRAKSIGHFGIRNFTLYKMKKSKFYLILCKKKLNYIYSKNKFLNKIKKITSNKTIHKRTFIQKNKMLLNIQDSILNLIDIEKNILKAPEIWNKENDKKYFEKIIYKSDENEFNFSSKKSCKCNLSIDLYNYIRTTINFTPFSSNLGSVKFIKNEYFYQNKRHNLKRKSFIIDKVQGGILLNSDYDKKKSEQFVITKSKIRYSEDFYWIYSPINLLSIQGLIIRANNNYYMEEKGFRSKNRRISTIRRLSLGFNPENFHKRTIKRQLSLDKNISCKQLTNLKKSIRLQLKEFSILNQKIFFKRGKTKKKKMNNILSLNNNLSDSSESVNLEDVYTELLINIFEGKNRQFIVCYEKNKKFIDLNQKLIGGNTLLITCVKEGNITICRFLCDQGINVNIQNNSGNTALHYAIGGHFYSIADILKRYGAREDIENNLGLLPWDCIENNFE